MVTRLVPLFSNDALHRMQMIDVESRFALALKYQSKLQLALEVDAYLELIALCDIDSCRKFVIAIGRPIQTTKSFALRATVNHLIV